MARQLGRLLLSVSLAAIVTASCGGGGGSSDGPGSTGRGAPAGQANRLPPGAVTLVALGDSLTAGDGDDSGQGYAGRLFEAIGAETGRADSTLVNLGASGWDSTMMVDGPDGEPSELARALDEVRSAVDSGRGVLATVLIGSNDLWYVYEYGPPEGTPPESENAAVDTYRRNLDRAVRELRDAGALVIVGLPDDQSLRTGVADIGRLNELLPNVTAGEVDQMAVLAKRLVDVAEQVADDHGALVVDTNAPFWATQSKMADDGIHPNGAGYSDLAELWLAVIREVL